ncbi:ABC transporter substrate-binding protein [Fulvivirga sp. M361]|uniref:ABC transporter substrate-binding protein n=1 Tax=Fulvivirga sp. M361 TaxID=2594266 RepID=UPI00117ABBE9|nr:ABC transporter substrate-binding protein [Fulvivirga sp. M361]TRX62761.1 ABC transporter substrate-binding protein [Fulvivirga sp. M361]
MKKVINTITILFYSGLYLIGCHPGKDEKEHRKVVFESHKERTRYAARFDIVDSGKYKILSIIKPKGKQKGVDYQYVLFERGQDLPDQFPEAHPLAVPLQRFTLRSPVEAAMVTLLGNLEDVVAIADPKWIANPYLLEKAASGEISVIGRGNTINTELVLKLQPEAIFENASGNKYDITRQLIELGLTPMMNCVHLEDHPLGVAEWIKYFGVLLNKEKQAKALFDTIASRYDSLALLVKDVEDRPAVIVGHSSRGMWSTHGSSNFFIQLIHDAGGRYILEDSTQYEENRISFEHAFIKGQQADFWLGPGHLVEKLETLIAEDERYLDFKSVKQSGVYNNNRWLSEEGHNHYWEEGMVEPHILLADLVRIFHPDVLRDHQLKYFQPIQ